MENLTNSTTSLPSTIVQVTRMVLPQVLLLPTDRRSTIGATKSALDNVTTKIWNETKENDMSYAAPKNAIEMLGQYVFLLSRDLARTNRVTVQAYQTKTLTDAEAIDHVSCIRHKCCN